jgi:phosphohistidine phosphatase
MKIFIFRHGEAVPKNDPAVASDPERVLVEEGIRRTRQSAEGLQKLGITPEIIFTSPWIRAKQTADIVGEVLGLPGVQEMDELAGDRSVEDVMRALSKQKYGEIMLVGHEPLLGDIAAYLLSLSTGMQLDLKKSGACAVEVERIPPKSPGMLLWMMSAKQLRSIR